jgi:hypothetical protein
MKVYQIMATVIVEDEIHDFEIANICRENIEIAIREDFYIANCITHFALKETIEYEDTPPRDPKGEQFDNWMKKSQEVIDRIQMEMRNP